MVGGWVVVWIFLLLMERWLRKMFVLGIFRLVLIWVVLVVFLIVVCGFGMWLIIWCLRLLLLENSMVMGLSLVMNLKLCFLNLFVGWCIVWWV